MAKITQKKKVVGKCKDKTKNTEVKVNFLLVGHTHDHSDQMFSTFSRQLSRCDAFTLPKLFDDICDAYTPRPNVIHLKEIKTLSDT